MFRPLLLATLTNMLRGCARVAVLDRDLSPGVGGILWAELRGVAEREAIVQNYLLGLGGGDIRPEHIERIIDDLCERGSAGEPVFMEAGE
jgi:pyruvate/2-oxoacid:ferredoxin oxidoreductase alpha subunit